MSSVQRPRRAVLRRDASMTLLTDLVESALEPGYRTAQQTNRARNRWPIVAIGLCLAGLLLGMAAIQTTKQAPEVAKERTSLVTQIQQAELRNTELNQTLAERRVEVDQLAADQLGAGSSVNAETQRLGTSTGALAVTGPGVVITVDDADRLSGANEPSRVVDVDLRRLVNGLWSVGAEAVAINGHRLTTRTAIRGAGSAITVDYVSLTRPYKVEAIGDPKRLPADFNQSSGGVWWNQLKQNYRMRYDVSAESSLTLPADPGLGLRVSKGPK